MSSGVKRARPRAMPKIGGSMQTVAGTFMGGEGAVHSGPVAAADVRGIMERMAALLRSEAMANRRVESGGAQPLQRGVRPLQAARPYGSYDDAEDAAAAPAGQLDFARLPSRSTSMAQSASRGVSRASASVSAGDATSSRCTGAAEHAALTTPAATDDGSPRSRSATRGSEQAAASLGALSPIAPPTADAPARVARLAAEAAGSVRPAESAPHPHGGRSLDSHAAASNASSRAPSALEATAASIALRPSAAPGAANGPAAAVPTKLLSASGVSSSSSSALSGGIPPPAPAVPAIGIAPLLAALTEEGEPAVTPLTKDQLLQLFLPPEDKVRLRAIMQHQQRAAAAGSAATGADAAAVVASPEPKPPFPGAVPAISTFYAPFLTASNRFPTVRVDRGQEQGAKVVGAHIAGSSVRFFKPVRPWEMGFTAEDTQAELDSMLCRIDPALLEAAAGAGSGKARASAGAVDAADGGSATGDTAAAADAADARASDGSVAAGASSVATTAGDAQSTDAVPGPKRGRSGRRSNAACAAAAAAAPVASEADAATEPAKRAAPARRSRTRGAAQAPAASAAPETDAGGDGVDSSAIIMAFFPELQFGSSAGDSRPAAESSGGRPSRKPKAASPRGADFYTTAEVLDDAVLGSVFLYDDILIAMKKGITTPASYELAHRMIWGKQVVIDVWPPAPVGSAAGEADDSMTGTACAALDASLVDAAPSDAPAAKRARLDASVASMDEAVDMGGTGDLSASQSSYSGGGITGAYAALVEGTSDAAASGSSSGAAPAPAGDTLSLLLVQNVGPLVDFTIRHCCAGRPGAPAVDDDAAWAALSEGPIVAGMAAVSAEGVLEGDTVDVRLVIVRRFIHGAVAAVKALLAYFDARNAAGTGTGTGSGASASASAAASSSSSSYDFASAGASASSPSSSSLPSSTASAATATAAAAAAGWDDPSLTPIIRATPPPARLAALVGVPMPRPHPCWGMYGTVAKGSDAELQVLRENEYQCSLLAMGVHWGHIVAVIYFAQLGCSPTAKSDNRAIMGDDLRTGEAVMSPWELACHMPQAPLWLPGHKDAARHIVQEILLQFPDLRDDESSRRRGTRSRAAKQHAPPAPTPPAAAAVE